jgi:hypothetical protein
VIYGLILFCFCRLGFELTALGLLGRSSIIWATAPKPYSLFWYKPWGQRSISDVPYPHFLLSFLLSSWEAWLIHMKQRWTTQVREQLGA